MSFPRLAAALALFIPLIVSAADEPWDGAPFTADPKALVAAAEAIPAGDASVIVVLADTTWSFEADGRFRAVRREVWRVVDEQGVESAGTINIPWAPWYQEKPQLDARVIAKDGSVHRLDPGAITDAPSGQASLDIFSDERELRAPLPGVAAGSVIEYVSTQSGRSPIEGGGNVRVLNAAGYFPIHHFRLTIDTPSSLEPRIANPSGIKPAVSESGGRRQTIFEKRDIAAMDDVEWGLPFDESPYPYVAASTGTSWQDVARRYSDVVDAQIAGNDLKKLVAATIGTATDRGEIATRLLAAIQKDVRYAGVEVGAGSLVPRPPRTVLANKYGDCKDKATLLVAMLREAGYGAHVALLRAGTDFDVLPDLPGLGVFNHAIVVVDGDTPLWIDPTDEYARAGELPADDQGRNALIASASTTALVRTPEAPAEANLTIETRTATLPEFGRGTFSEVSETTGAQDASMRRWVGTTERKDLRESLEKYAKSHYFAKSVTKVETTDARDLAKPFLMTIEVAESERTDVRGGEAVVGFHPATLLYSLPDDLKPASNEKEGDRKKRIHDFVMPQPFAKEWRYRIVPPPGYVARKLPENETRKLGTMSLSRTYGAAPDGTITATLHFESGKRRITAAEYEETRTAIGKVLSGDQIVLGMDQIAQTKLNAGDVAGGLAELRRLDSLHPKEAQHHIELARALLNAGLGESARAEARLAVKIEPSNVRAHEILATVLEHDLLGRKHREGFDLPGAVAEWRKAKAADPKLVYIRTSLIDALLTGEDGLPYGYKAHVDDAIAECRAMLKDLGDEAKDQQPLLVPILLHAGRYAELKEFAATIDGADERDTARISAVALIEGAPAAVRELGAFDPAKRREYASTVGQSLVSLRAYGVAAELFDAAAQGSNNAANVRAYADVLRGIKPFQADVVPASDPRSVVYRIFDAGLKRDVAALKKTFVEDPEITGENESHERNPFEDFTRASRSANLSAEVLLDFASAYMRLQPEGDDAIGYRLRARIDMPGAPDNSAFTLYVTKEPDGYRGRGFDKTPGSVGASVLEFADAGKLDAARAWLNWMREDIEAGSADDPLSGAPFASLWPKSNASASVDEIRIAAAALMPGPDHRAKGASVLVAQREKASDAVKLKIDEALSEIYSIAEDWAKLAPVAERLFAAYPDSATAFRLYTKALANSGRSDEAAALANARLAKMGKDADALRALYWSAAQKGDYAAAEHYLQRIVDELTPTRPDLNNLAWLALFTGHDLERAIGYARRAGGDAKTNEEHALHTLAALLAESGKGVEAREVLLRSLDAGGSSRPNESDWYVLGRIAEDFGVRDAAAAAYKRVTKPKSADKESSYELAERRVAKLAKP